jgi:hypothetical protein
MAVIAASAVQQQHLPQRPAAANSAADVPLPATVVLAKLTAAPRLVVLSADESALRSPASRPAITSLTATGGAVGPQRESFRARRQSQNAPGGKPSSGANAQRRCVPACIGWPSNVGSDPSATAA